ncbi:MAG: hypothetical protein KDB26_13685 [Microthrixaceae bacterium]|nr:hypothetical protein [Microthrixaceae bacterium]
MSSYRSAPVLLRNIGVWFIVAVFYGFIGLLCVGALANSDVPVSGRAACAVIAVALVALAYWTFRAGILLRADGLTVRRYVGRDVHVGWADVLEAALVPNGKGGGFVAVFTRDGRVLKTQGLAVNSLGSEWGQAAVARINERRPITA